MDLPKSKWFWILAPIGAMLCIAFLLTFVQNAVAAPVSSCGEYQQCLEYEISNIAGVVSGGNIISKLLMPHVAHVGDQSGISNFFSTPGVSGTPSITYTISQVTGCTIGTQTNQSTVTTTFTTWTTDIPITITDTTCTGLLRIQFSAGTISTELADILHRFAIFTQNDLESLEKDCVASVWNSGCSITSFETITGLNVLEFFCLIILLVIAVIVWSRSNDFMVQLSMVALTFVPGVIWLLLWVAQHAILSMPLAILTFMLGGYMGIRSGIDQFTERSEKREG